MEACLKNGKWYAQNFLDKASDITKSLELISNKAQTKYTRYITVEKNRCQREIEKKKLLIIKLQKEKDDPEALKELQSLYPGLVPNR